MSEQKLVLLLSAQCKVLFLWVCPVVKWCSAKYRYRQIGNLFIPQGRTRNPSISRSLSVTVFVFYSELRVELLYWHG